MASTTLERFNEIIISLGEITLANVQEKIGTAGWKVARFSDRNNFSKLRVGMPDGSINKGVKTPTSGEFFDLLDEAWSLRDQAFAEKWYGLTISVFPDGKCEVTFDYNEDDPMFFDYEIKISPQPIDSDARVIHNVR